MTDLDFYNACAVLLRTTHTPHIVTGTWKKRWGPRTPGNGRFPNRGLIRVFGSQIHVALYTPPFRAIFPSKSAALDGLHLTCQEFWANEGEAYEHDHGDR